MDIYSKKQKWKLNYSFNCDNIIKILGYDEWSMSEKRSVGGTSSSFFGTSHKIYKFYICLGRNEGVKECVRSL